MTHLAHFANTNVLFKDHTNVISVNELKLWLAGLRDDDFVGMDEGGCHGTPCVDA